MKGGREIIAFVHPLLPRLKISRLLRRLTFAHLALCAAAISSVQLPNADGVLWADA
jgi:hypothetical protein